MINNPAGAFVPNVDAYVEIEGTGQTDGQNTMMVDIRRL
jgi:hypothetical protein